MIGPNCKEPRAKGPIKETKKRKSRETRDGKQGSKRKIAPKNGAEETTKSVADNKVTLVKKSKCLVKTGDTTERVAFDTIEMHSLGDPDPVVALPKLPLVINSKRIDELIDEMESMTNGKLPDQEKDESIIEEFLDISQCRIVHDDEGNFNLINEHANLIDEHANLIDDHANLIDDQELNSFTAKDYYDYILGYGEQEDVVSSTSGPAPVPAPAEPAPAPVSEPANPEPTSSKPTSKTPPPATEADDLNEPNFSWLLNFKVASIFDPNADPGSKDSEEEAKEAQKVEPRPMKPPFTYTELIDQALKEKGQLTVSNIYSWISERFPFYRPNDDRWKNSVRHNLSINPHFRKGNKAPHGAGHFWILSNNEGVTTTTTTATTTATTTPTTTLAPEPQSQPSQKKSESPVTAPAATAEGETKDDYNWEEVLEATRNIEQTLSGDTFSLDSGILCHSDSQRDDGRVSEEGKGPGVEADALSLSLSPVLSAVRDPTLHETAGDILNGIKKRVEVQYLEPINQMSLGSQIIDHNDDQDHSECFFTSSILKEIDGGICLLERDNDYLMSDLNETLFNEALNFQSFTLSSHL